MAFGLNDIRKFFGYENLAQFRKDWSELTDADKTQIRTGLENGSLTY